jgi:SAM-dependent methyltransferase
MNMCHAQCILFAALNIARKEIYGKKVTEVGSMDVNGSLRPLLESFKPKQYLGIDVIEGRGVDVVCNAEDLMRNFQKQSFDVLISTEMLEHVRNWKLVISNFKNVVKSGGKIVITTRSYGFPYHGYPYDFWRYELEDIKKIFSDCVIERLERDPEKGVFAKIVKPENFIENDLSDYELYSMIVKKRVSCLSEKEFQVFLRRWERNRRLRLIRKRLKMVVLFPEQVLIR